MSVRWERPWFKIVSLTVDGEPLDIHSCRVMIETMYVADLPPEQSRWELEIVHCADIDLDGVHDFAGVRADGKSWEGRGQKNLNDSAAHVSDGPVQLSRTLIQPA